MRFALWPCFISLLLAGCASTEYSSSDPSTGSPTGALLRGDITADQYFGEIKKANESTRKQEQFEINKEPTRAYNTKTQQFEYVPDGTTQKWNEATQRWEFTPVK